MISRPRPYVVWSNWILLWKLKYFTVYAAWDPSSIFSMTSLKSQTACRILSFPLDLRVQSCPKLCYARFRWVSRIRLRHFLKLHCASLVYLSDHTVMYETQQGWSNLPSLTTNSTSSSSNIFSPKYCEKYIPSWNGNEWMSHWCTFRSICRIYVATWHFPRKKYFYEEHVMWRRKSCRLI